MDTSSTKYRDEDKRPESEIPEFLTYPRQFITYKWYRPVITGVLTGVILMIFIFILIIVTGMIAGGGFQSIRDMVMGGYDTMDVYTAPGALLSLGNLALIIPALAIGNMIAGRRTFRSYESSRGGWDFGIFFKCLLTALILVAVPVACDCIFYYGKSGAVQFTAIGLLVCLILGPLQCIGEEFMLRGFLAQILGSWFKAPVIAVILQAVVFASMHPYNIIGVTETLMFGLTAGVITWLTKGLEASSAYHICNNMAIFICTGFGYGAVKSESDIRSLVLSTIIGLVFLAAVIICRKRGMFDNYRANDAAEYNAKIEAKLAVKSAKTGGQVTE